MVHKEATNGDPGLVVKMTTPLTYWWGTKGPQMVSLALWLKWLCHLQSDRAQRGHKWWAWPCGLNDHTTYILIGHKDGEPGLVVEMTTPLTYWWGTKGPPMMRSQALLSKWPHHLHTDSAQRVHKWWVRPCGWNYHTTYFLMGHKEATNGEPGLVVEMTTPLTHW